MQLIVVDDGFRGKVPGQTPQRIYQQTIKALVFAAFFIGKAIHQFHSAKVAERSALNQPGYLQKFA